MTSAYNLLLFWLRQNHRKVYDQWNNKHKDLMTFKQHQNDMEREEMEWDKIH